MNEFLFDKFYWKFFTKIKILGVVRKLFGWSVARQLMDVCGGGILWSLEVPKIILEVLCGHALRLKKYERNNIFC